MLPPVALVPQSRALITRVSFNTSTIAGAHQLRQITEQPVGPAARITVEMEQPARRPLVGGVLGDQFGRQDVVEVVEVHAAAL